MSVATMYVIRVLLQHLLVKRNKMSTNTSNALEYLLKPQDTGSRGEIGQLHM